MFCGECGSKLAEGAKFCQSCGTKVPTETKSEENVVDVAETAPASEETAQAENPALSEDTTNDDARLNPTDEQRKAYFETQASEEPLAQANTIHRASAAVNSRVPADASRPAKQGKGKLIALVAAGLVAMFWAIGSFAQPGTQQVADPNPSASPTQTTAAPALTLAQIMAEIPQQKISKAQCKPLVAVAKNSKNNSKAKKQTAAAKKYTKNSYSAYDYKKKNKWVRDPYNLQTSFNKKYNTQLSTLLNKLVKRVAAPTFTVAEVSENKSNLIVQLKAKVGLDCSLNKTVSQTESILSKRGARGEQIVSLAADRPWYPRGFQEWEAGLAWRWVDKSADCYDCHYWHIAVIADHNCPSGIYAEINILNNGSVVDWTNDTVPVLRAHRKAILEFTTYNDNIDSGSLETLNCY